MQPLGMLSCTCFVTFVTSQQPPSKMLKNGTKAQTDANVQEVKSPPSAPPGFYWSALRPVLRFASALLNVKRTFRLVDFSLASRDRASMRSL